MDAQLNDFLTSHLTNLTRHYVDGYHPTRFEYKQYSIGIHMDHSIGLSELVLNFCTILKKIVPNIQIEVVADFGDSHEIVQALAKYSDVRFVKYPRDVKVVVDTFDKFIIDFRSQEDDKLRAYVHFQGPSQRINNSVL